MAKTTTRTVRDAQLSASRLGWVIAHPGMKYFASQGGVSYHRHSTNKISSVGFAAIAETAAGQMSGLTISDLAHKDPRKSQLEFNKLRKRLRRQMGKAIADFDLIEQGDRVMVCISGGKDSHVMLELLIALRESAPINFEIVAVTLDQKQPDYPAEVLPAYLETLGVPFYILERDTYSVVKSVIPEGKTTCGLCSRLRRGTLYGFAEEIGATKIALGHHRDDIVETLFLNLFFGGKLKAMPVKLRSDDGRNVVIRPLAYCRESDLARYAVAKAFPIIPCNLCGTQENLQRQEIKQMLQAWEKQYPGRTETIFRSLGNAAPSHLLDRTLFDFSGLSVERDDSLGLPDIRVVNL